MIENDDERPISRNQSQATRRRSPGSSGGSTDRDGSSNGNGNGYGYSPGFGSGGDYGYGSGDASYGSSRGRPSDRGGRTERTVERTGRNGGGNGGGRNGGGNGGRTDRGWQPVELGPRPGSRDLTKASDMPPGFRRVDNGSPRYSGPVHTDPTYSPTYYHFNRVRAHEFSNPSNIWIGLFAIVGVALAVLIIFAIPQFLTHNAPALPVETPTAPATDNGYIVAPPTTNTQPTERPVYTPTPTPAPTFRTYTVKVGDTLSRIASKFGLKTWELQAANPGLQVNPDAIYVGMVINIPKHGQLTPAPPPT
jgi:LysM repeat protein